MRFLYAVLPAMLVLSGCTSSHVDVERLSNNSAEGVCFTLPKTLLQVTIIYSVERRTCVDFGKESVKYAGNVEIRTAPAVAPVLIPDTPNTFVIKTNDKAGGLLLDTKQQYILDDSGMLLSVDSDMTDRTVDVIKELGGTAVSIAKLAARGNNRPPTPQERLQQKLDKLYDQITTYNPDASADASSDASSASSAANLDTRGMSPSPPAKTKKTESNTQPSSPDSLQPHPTTQTAKNQDPTAPPNGSDSHSTAPLFRDKQRNDWWLEASALRTLLNAYQQDHRCTVDQCQQAYVVLVDPANFQHAPDGSLQYLISPPQLFQGDRDAEGYPTDGKPITPDQMPNVLVKLIDPPAPPAPPTETKFDGIIYRPTRIIETRLLLVDPKTNIAAIAPTPAGASPNPVNDDLVPASSATVTRPAAPSPAEIPDTGQLLLIGYFSYPQFSPFFTVHLHSKMFAGTATALQFSAGSGGLRSMNVSKGSSTLGAAQALNATVGAAADSKAAVAGTTAAKSTAAKSTTGAATSTTGTTKKPASP